MKVLLLLDYHRIIRFELGFRKRRGASREACAATRGCEQAAVPYAYALLRFVLFCFVLVWFGLVCFNSVLNSLDCLIVHNRFNCF